MRKRIQPTVALLLTASALLFAGTGTPRNNSNSLQSFFVVSHVVSDAGPFWFTYILDVKPVRKGALVRDIRIAPLNASCPRSVTVKAFETVLPHSSVRSVAKIPLCSIKEVDVRSAIAAARTLGATIDDTVGFTIVAKCGTTDRVFDLPYAETIDFNSLKRMNPAVVALYNLSEEISRKAFGKRFSFYGVSRSQDSAFQELGAKLVPDLESGMYDQGFSPDGSLSAAMAGYVGSIEDQDPRHVEVSGMSPARLRKYLPPRYPPLALQARIQGDVHLHLTVDVPTGKVKAVVATSGHPILQASAIKAARQWRFRPHTQLKGSVDAVVKFELRCPARPR